jgi:hypothetical protein
MFENRYKRAGSLFLVLEILLYALITGAIISIFVM